MAEFDETMSRLARLEEGVDRLNHSMAGLNHAMVQVSEILLDQNQRLDRLEAAQQGTNERLDRLEAAQQGTNERLDRLIELQTRSFTGWAERFQSQEQRLTRLEARVDRLEK